MTRELARIEITGPAGSGKTTLAALLIKAFSAMDIKTCTAQHELPEISKLQMGRIAKQLSIFDGKVVFITTRQTPRLENRTTSPDGMTCGCATWGRDDINLLISDPKQHHPNCPFYRRQVEISAIRELIVNLVRGIENWANQELGIPSAMFDAYKAAKLAIGEPVNGWETDPVEQEAVKPTTVIPENVTYSPEMDNFYDQSNQGLGLEFFREWKPHCDLFPTRTSKGSIHVQPKSQQESVWS